MDFNPKFPCHPAASLLALRLLLICSDPNIEPEKEVQSLEGEELPEPHSWERGSSNSSMVAKSTVAKATVKYSMKTYLSIGFTPE